MSYKENSIIRLTEELLSHKWKYYVLGEPDITDWEYDQLEEKLYSIDPDSLIFQTCGYSEEDHQAIIQDTIRRIFG